MGIPVIASAEVSDTALLVARDIIIHSPLDAFYRYNDRFGPPVKTKPSAK